MDPSIPQRRSPHRKQDPRQACLSCGTTVNMDRRKYCSIQCRQRLHYKLDVRTGLLKALNTRHATFYFTESLIILDVLPYGSEEIFSFLYPRSARKTPADDFSNLADTLGNVWWAERKRSQRSYLASRQVLAQADRQPSLRRSLEPLEVRSPAVKATALVHLRLGKSDLDTPKLEKCIKAAFRRQAMRHHPDMGGDSATFRRIHGAYRELLQWAENPRFSKRLGFPDKWFYNGVRNRWVQPTPRPDRPG